MPGKRIGLKDNIALAGVPMTLGSRLLETYVPAEDCLVAQRPLAAGAEVVAKLNMDGFAWSAGGETSDFGPILNPVDPSRTASRRQAAVRPRSPTSTLTSRSAPTRAGRYDCPRRGAGCWG